METVRQLKQEINSALDSLHDFAKWKLIVTSALAAAALGLGNTNAPPRYWLLLLVPFACAYIDLNSYQYLIRIFVIAKFLRIRSGIDDEEQILRLYEQFRQKHRAVFALGEYAQVGASLVFSLLAPVFAVTHLTGPEERWGFRLSLVAWGLGVALVISVWRLFKH